MNKKISENEIKDAKNYFNKFFQDYLYWNYDNEENIILSRWIWEDSFVKHPDIIKFTLEYTINKQWLGYSDSLWHDNVFSELKKLIQIDSSEFSQENLALTIWNVSWLNYVYQHLRKKYKEENKSLNTLSVKPFYPSILDSVSWLNEFDVKLINTFDVNEKEVFEQIKNELEKWDISNLLIPNFIWVDGRTYSENFFEKLINLCEKLNIDLVIDEPTWFKKIKYPENIVSDKVIRLVSLSKMFWLAGAKMWYLVWSKEFIKEYYNTASSWYGWPLSMLFLTQEFIYNFEKNRLNNNEDLDKNNIELFKKRYDIKEEKINSLYKNYISTLNENYKNFLKHYEVVKKWYEKNKYLFKKALLNKENPAINTIFELDEEIIDFKFFVSLIKLYKTSVFPGSCIGLDKNTFRLNFLEQKENLEKWLNNISELLEKYKKRIKEDIKFIIFDLEKLKNNENLEDIMDTIKYKKIKFGLVWENLEVNNLLKNLNLKIDFILIKPKEKIKNVSEIIKKLGFINEDVIYFRENSETNDKEQNSIKNILLLET